MGAFTFATLEPVGTVERFQVRYIGTNDQVAMFDVLVDLADPERVIRIGKPDTSYADAQPTAGRAATVFGLSGDQVGAKTLPEDCALTERVSDESVANYIYPRIFPFIPRVHGTALTGA